MTGFINSLDGSKIAILLSFFLAMGAMLFIGIHLVTADGSETVPILNFFEGIVNSVLIAGGGISSIHVVTGAIVQAKQAKQQQAKTGEQPSA